MDPLERPEGAERPAEPVQPTRATIAPRIPGYRIEGVIGRGATGTVYRAVQLAVEREVALKVLHPELARKPRIVQRLQREARTMARLAHPHVVGAIDMGEIDGRWWFAMELVDGPSLAQTLRTSGPLSEREALRLFAPLCEALEHLWEHGVVHRDIKPANILLERTGRGEARNLRARLADLGLAVGEQDPNLTRQGGTLGTPHYISPEQAKDSRGVDVRSDLWALGATLFHAVCGRPPFDGESTAEVLSAVLHQPVPDPRRLNPDLSHGLALVLRKCLVREPGRRYQTPAELLSDLDRLRERRAPHVLRADLDPLERDPRPWRRPLPWLATAAVAGAAALAFQLQRPIDGPSGEVGESVSAQAYLVRAAEYVEGAEAEPLLWLAALAELDTVRLEVGASDAWKRLNDRAIAGLEREVSLLRSSTVAGIDSALGRGDAVAAATELDALDTALRSRLGRGIAELPQQVGLGLGRLEEVLEKRIAGSIASRVDNFEGAALVHFETLVEPEVDRLLRAECWRSARRLLDRTPTEILVAAGLSPSGLPQGAIEDATAGVRVRMAQRRGRLDDGWIAREHGLIEFVRGAAVELVARQWPDVPGEPARVLADALATELERLGLDRVEALGEPVLQVDRAIVELARATTETVAANLAIGAERDAELRRTAVDPSLGRRRRYGELTELWSEFEARCAAVPPALSTSGWADALALEARARHTEGQLLDGVLQRAADAIVALRHKDASFEVAHQVRPVGAVSSSSDPLRDGFKLETAGRVYVLDLRVGVDLRISVGREDLESLSGLALPLRDLAPEQALALACLRRRERGGAGLTEVLGECVFPQGEDARRLMDIVRRSTPMATQEPGTLLEALGIGTSAGLVATDGELAAWIAAVLLFDHLRQDERVQLLADKLRAIAGDRAR